MGTTASSLRSSATGGTHVHRPLTVVSPLSENDWANDERLSEVDDRNDNLDDFNRPRLRRRLILQSLLTEPCHPYPVVYVSAAATAAKQKQEKEEEEEEVRTATTGEGGAVGPSTDDTAAAEQQHNNDNDSGDENENILQHVYGSTHTPGLLKFLSEAWEQWERLGEEGRDPSGWSPLWKPPSSPSPTTTTPRSSRNVEEVTKVVPPKSGEDGKDEAATTPIAESQEISSRRAAAIPPLVPTNSALPRSMGRQRPSKHVLGQVGYYCTDTVTPIFAELLHELRADAYVVQTVATAVLQHFDDTAVTGGASSSSSSSPMPQSPPVWYALPTHPGHHAASDSFGGYCYLNHAAALANLLSSSSLEAEEPHHHRLRVAILDVDYHCGNGTADIFAARGDVLVVSLHCHPDYDYPFHSGFADDVGVDGDDDDDAVADGGSSNGGRGATLHLPLPPGTVWTDYQRALTKGLAKIRSFDAHVCLVSLGLDTHDGDPCAIRRAGFALHGTDYTHMGQTIAKHLSGIPLVFVQEGGYKLDVIGEVAASVLLGACSER